MEWIKTSERLPTSGMMVFIYGKNNLGNSRRLRAYYVHKDEIESMEDDCSEYNEDKDCYYLPKGWYECNEFEDTNWSVEFPITHWMYLPEPPKANS